MYAADTFNRRVQRLPRGGTTFEPWRDSGDGVDFEKPTGVFVDAEDVIHVCDSVAETVYRFDRAGALIDRWSLPEILGTASEPEDIVIDATGSDLYIAEVRGHRVFHLTRTP